VTAHAGRTKYNLSTPTVITVHTDTYLNVKGDTIFVRRWHPAVASSSVPLVLLHDSLGCVDLWRDFPATLVRQLGRPVVAYDRIGFGRSSERKELPAAGFIREEAEKFFPTVRAGLGIADFAVFGHCVGGAMALLAAARDGDRCKAVVCESAQAFVEDRTVAGNPGGPGSVREARAVRAAQEVPRREGAVGAGCVDRRLALPGVRVLDP
jgi:pimeloyl-ACP methyl ester carboxylesterase